MRDLLKKIRACYYILVSRAYIVGIYTRRNSFYEIKAAREEIRDHIIEVDEMAEDCLKQDSALREVAELLNCPR